MSHRQHLLAPGLRTSRQRARPAFSDTYSADDQMALLAGKDSPAQPRRTSLLHWPGEWQGSSAAGGHPHRCSRSIGASRTCPHRPLVVKWGRENTLRRSILQGTGQTGANGLRTPILARASHVNLRGRGQPFRLWLRRTGQVRPGVRVAVHKECSLVRER